MGEEAEPGDGNCVRREENSDGHRVVGNAHLREQFVFVAIFLQVHYKDNDEDDAKKNLGQSSIGCLQ